MAHNMSNVYHFIQKVMHLLISQQKMTDENVFGFSVIWL